MKPESKVKLMYSICPYCEKRCIKRSEKLFSSGYNNRIYCPECEEKVIVLTFGSYILGGIFLLITWVISASIFTDYKIIMLVFLVLSYAVRQVALWFAPLDTEDKKNPN